MSLIINGTTINGITFNNTSINTLMCDEEEVYSGIPAIYETVKNATTNITQAHWLEFVDKGCIKIARTKGETSSFIGKNVTLNNWYSSYKSWKIADFNHDSSGNTVDLIQNNSIASRKFSDTFKYYSGSSIRTWLTGSYLSGFDTDVKNKIQTMTVGSNSDKIKLLSGTEVGYSDMYMSYDGSKYPIFTSDNNRRRSDSTGYVNWWLRSSNTASGDLVFVVGIGGYKNTYTYNYTQGVVPCIRFA